MDNGHPDLMFNSNNWHHDRHVKYIFQGIYGIKISYG